MNKPINKCFFCQVELTEENGDNSLYPFDKITKEDTGCCNKCNHRYILPARCLYDKDLTPDYRLANALSEIIDACKSDERKHL